MTFNVKDHYFHKAKKENFLARSVYKLEEIDQRFKVLKSGDAVLDLGYHPGSWVQYSSKKVGMKGLVVGVDLREVNTKLNGTQNVSLLQMDAFGINDPSAVGAHQPFDVVLSDMAPNTTGIKSVDQIRSLDLVEKVFSLLPSCLRPGGNVVVKVFDGPGAHDFVKSQKPRFAELEMLRPKSTRSVSKEFFVIAKGFKA
jgi:23S rRNA (uridine2552-2'-O)-methyltransferase